MARSAGASLRRHNEAALEQVIYYKHELHYIGIYFRKYKTLFSNGLSILKNLMPYLLELQFTVKLHFLVGRNHYFPKVFKYIQQ